ncbi:hypothetical protein ENSA5_09360 [Enhygromyxa salina]|uniref:Lipoprotein n=1 Tax=Enhygromyxa salina TaxID=215803 RepID=A0A2S9YGQ6_9BACT|nr:hypothetical protein [Enhygromyxa salina]PRQ04287.1 hypothetical protein ENSA5_09360 [Enhygromyxa salina]
MQVRPWSALSVGFSCWAVLGCGAQPAEPAPAHERPPAGQLAPSVEPEPAPDPRGPAAPSEAAEPGLPAFDPLTATRAEVRIVVVHGGHWVACGVVHSVAAIEVEVLGVGEPPPRMALYVSCPADHGRDKQLVVGNTFEVTLHARRQPWPKPPVTLAPELPVRYVKGLELLGATAGL